MDLTGRDLLGFLAAALTPGLLLFAAVPLSGAPEWAIQFFFAGVALAGIHVALIAMPVFMLLSLRGRPSLASILVAATLIGALPASMFGLAVEGGIEAFATFGAVFGAFGFAGGVAFALVTRPSRAR
jgi:hypothetical protein